MANPILGVFFHWVGGALAASFYAPYRRVRRWSWEIFWITGGVFSWLIAPWLVAWLRTEDLAGVMANVPLQVVFWSVFFGALWGFGGLTYGLTMRYLGFSLGMAVVLGLTIAFGTLVPPIYRGDFQTQILATRAGNVILFGIALTIVAIIIVARAGAKKDAALTPDQAKEGVLEFDFRKGLAVAIFSGVMSSCFAFGLAAAEPLKSLTAAAGTPLIWQGLPSLCLVMFGGLITNSIWCAYLIRRNGSAWEWIGREANARNPALATETAASRHTPLLETVEVGEARAAIRRTPLLANYLLCAVAGLMWYFQFFLYSMGESQMGRFGFSSWTLHLGSVIIFGTVLGFAFGEWKRTREEIRIMVWSGVALLLVATVIIGYGNKMAAM